MNKTALRVVMLDHEETYNDLAEVLGITAPTLSDKINSRVDCGFTQPEILTIKEHYHLSPEQVDLIFFAK